MICKKEELEMIGHNLRHLGMLILTLEGRQRMNYKE